MYQPRYTGYKVEHIGSRLNTSMDHQNGTGDRILFNMSYVTSAWDQNTPLEHKDTCPMTPVLNRVASRERDKGTTFLSDPLDEWVGRQSYDEQKGYALARGFNQSCVIYELRKTAQQELEQRPVTRTVAGDEKNDEGAEAATGDGTTAAAAGTGVGTATTAYNVILKPSQDT